jgi:hypothetical protein
MIAYPQLPRTLETEKLANRLARESVDTCFGLRALTHHLAASSSGGSPADKAHMKLIASKLTDIAAKYGYPDVRERNVTRQSDIEMGIELIETMEISPMDAANPNVWHFLTCVLVPDIVAWRFPFDKGSSSDSGPNIDRWMTIRYRERNCFGRLWWRVHTLREEEKSNPYKIVRALNEDEFIQITERPLLRGYRDLTLEMMRMLIKEGNKNKDLVRAELLREVIKRLMRYGALLDFNALDKKIAHGLLKDIFDQSLEADRVWSRKVKTARGDREAA